MLMSSTIYTIYTRDPETGEPVYQCETPDEDCAADETDRINGNMARAGVPCTAFYLP
jgi:hypothetical protein